MNNGQEHVLYQNILTSELKMLSSKTKKKNMEFSQDTSNK